MRISIGSTGLGTGFTCSVGKSGKYMKRHLSDGEWKRFLETYADGEPDHIWHSVEVMCCLFDGTAREIAKLLHFTYNALEAEHCMAYLAQVRKLPADADRIWE